MERREHPRIQLPLLVELNHPSIGRKHCVARDISEGGVYVQIDVQNEAPGIRVGATVRLTLKNPTTIDTQPTPTVEMEVRRVEESGIGFSFKNRTSRHLWESVERLRDELAVGRDYFQLHVAALIMKETGRLLVVQQNGKWTFPGTYLVVGDSWQSALSRVLAERFSLHVDAEDLKVLTIETESSEAMPEAAVAKVFAIATADTEGFSFSPGDRYKDSRWLQNPRMIDELTFADEVTRRQARAAFRWLAAQEAET
jgi:ADP-ribose pyrophosphatase YjhB (NUDIX family)